MPTAAEFPLIENWVVNNEKLENGPVQESAGAEGELLSTRLLCLIFFAESVSSYQQQLQPSLVEEIINQYVVVQPSSY